MSRWETFKKVYFVCFSFQNLTFLRTVIVYNAAQPGDVTLNLESMKPTQDLYQIFMV